MVRVECCRRAPVEEESVGSVDDCNIWGRVGSGAGCNIGIVHYHEIRSVKFRCKTISASIRGPLGPFLFVAVQISQDDGVGDEERRNGRSKPRWSRRGWRYVDVCDLEVLAGDINVDDDGFRVTVVDGRGFLREL